MRQQSRTFSQCGQAVLITAVVASVVVVVVVAAVVVVVVVAVAVAVIEVKRSCSQLFHSCLRIFASESESHLRCIHCSNLFGLFLFVHLSLLLCFLLFECLSFVSPPLLLSR